MADSSKRYFALIYYVGPDFAEKRGPHRERHLKMVFEANRRGELVHGGALGDPADRALLVFRVADRSTVEAFAKADPYVTSGLVQRWEVQPWAIVCGLREGDVDPLAGQPALTGMR
jgi:uncharacterized protein YciI